MERIKTYVILIQNKFPCFHKRAGHYTNFSGLVNTGDKIHVLQSNFKLWKKRISEVNSGRAVLSVRKWQGKANSGEQIELLRLSKENAPGCQKLLISKKSDFIMPEVDHQLVPFSLLASNEGLCPDDFVSWFNLTGPKEKQIEKVIIHFTPFRYL